jgi:phosphoenolpyruvate-protein kinase (PTS system EI component)
MVVGLGEKLLEAPDGGEVVLDGDEGVLVLAPDAALRTRAAAAVLARGRERRRLAASRGLPAVTRDGRRIRLLCNAAGPEEVLAGLAAGAEGVGLLRTELAFLEATSWPTESEHAAALEPVLTALGRRVATVRTLDFGADKTPPFLAGVEERGLALMLAHPEALLAQLRALARVGRGAQIRVLLPMVESAEQVEAVRALLPEAWPLGAMIETPGAAGQAAEIAAVADFISIGTNDLVQYTLGLDRELPLASALAAAHPTVLGHIAHVVEAAHAEGLSVEVCGEAAGEPPVVALLVGLGVDELSVAPARLDVVRETVRSVAFSDEAGDERGEALDGLGSVRA